MNVHNDFMCDQQILKIAPSVSWLGTDQQTGHLHNGTMVSNKRNTCNNGSESQMCMWKKPGLKCYLLLLFLLYDLLKKAGLFGHKADQWLMGAGDGEVDYGIQGTSENAKEISWFLDCGSRFETTIFSVWSECSDLYTKMDILHCI